MIDKKSPKWLSVEKKILETAYALLNQEDSKVSVKSVCCLAGISRSSFYQHYSDLDALLLKIKDDQLKMIRKMYSNKRIKNKNNTFINILKYAKNNKYLFINVFKRLHFEQYNADNLRMIKHHIDHMISNESGNDSDQEISVMYRHTYFHSALINCIVLWLNRGCTETEAELSKILFECSTTDLYSFFTEINNIHDRFNT